MVNTYSIILAPLLYTHLLLIICGEQRYQTGIRIAIAPALPGDINKIATSCLWAECRLLKIVIYPEA